MNYSINVGIKSTGYEEHRVKGLGHIKLKRTSVSGRHSAQVKAVRGRQLSEACQHLASPWGRKNPIQKKSWLKEKIVEGSEGHTTTSEYIIRPFNETCCITM